jgi:Emfourin
MFIRVRRTGGFAGIDEEVGSVDTASLAPDTRDELERLVQETDFFALPAAVEGEVGADQFRYEVTVEDGIRAHTVTFVGDEGPQVAALRRIVSAAGG